MKRGMLAALALCAATAAAAADEDQPRWYLQIDNDVAFGTDRWYSSGIRIARVHRDIEWGLVQEVYTPEAKHWQPGRNDRAPVGRLLVSAARHHHAPGVHHTAELAAGVRGPAALGEESTDAIHRLIPAPEVDWSRQLENRFDAQLALVRSQSLGSDRVKAHGGVVIGRDVSFVHAGLEWRVGAREAMSSALLRFAPTPPEEPCEYGWSAMAGVSARGVARNALLERNYDPFGPAITRRRAVARIVGGVAWAQSWGGVSLELAQDSREFDGQRTPHRFGSLALHLNF